MSSTPRLHLQSRVRQSVSSVVANVVAATTSAVGTTKMAKVVEVTTITRAVSQRERATMSRVISIVVAMIATLAVACSTPQRSVVMHDTNSDIWDISEEFYYDNCDSLTKRDIAIAVRYGNGYVADSVALSILCVSPDSLVVEEPFTLHIPHIGDLRPEEHTFVYRRNAVLSTKGRYTFRLTPHNAVEGISSVGLIISESSNSAPNKNND
jgi:hypothetical protein